MSIKINRYQSTEGGNFSMNGRRVMNIRVPDVGFTDLGNSYVVFRVQPTVTDTLGNTPIYPMVFSDPTSIPGGAATTYSTAGPQSLIRDFKVTYEKAPWVTNEQQQQNVYNHNTDWYLNSRGNQDAACPLTGSANYNYGTIGASGLPNSPFIQYSRPTVLPAAGGSTNCVTYSQMKDADMRIPMKHADQLADGMHQFPMAAFGSANYLLNLENVINVVSPAQMPQNIPCANITLATNGIVGNAANPFTLTEKFATNARLNDIPIYVGAPINFTLNMPAGTVGGTLLCNSGIINTIKLLPGGTLSFTLATPVDTTIAAAQVLTGIVVTYQGYDPTGAATYNYPNYGDVVKASNPAFTYRGLSASWLITNAYVELHELKLLPDQLKVAGDALKNLELPYLEVRTVFKQMLETDTVYADTVPYDPGCVGLAIMLPQFNTLTSGFDNASQYRHKINNFDVEGRWVVVGPDQESSVGLPVGRQYHNYLLRQHFQNLGKSLKKYDAPNFNYTAYASNSTHGMIPLVVNDSDRTGTISINIQAGGTMQQKTVFWQFLYRRAIQIQGGRVVKQL